MGAPVRQRAKHLLKSYLPPSPLLVTMGLRLAGSLVLHMGSTWFTGWTANVLMTFSHILLFMAFLGAFAHMEATFVAHLFVAFHRLRNVAQRLGPQAETLQALLRLRSPKP
jgi:hypothetical protein